MLALGPTPPAALEKLLEGLPAGATRQPAGAITPRAGAKRPSHPTAPGGGRGGAGAGGGASAGDGESAGESAYSVASDTDSSSSWRDDADGEACIVTIPSDASEPAVLSDTCAKSAAGLSLIHI